MLLFLFLACVVLFFIGWAVVGLVFKLLWWALIGLFIGALARLIIPGRQPIGVFATALDGIAGALLGGIIGNAANLGGVAQFLIAVGVAALLVLVFSAGQAARPRGTGTGTNF